MAEKHCQIVELISRICHNKPSRHRRRRRRRRRRRCCCETVFTFDAHYWKIFPNLEAYKEHQICGILPAVVSTWGPHRSALFQCVAATSQLKICRRLPDYRHQWIQLPKMRVSTMFTVAQLAPVIRQYYVGVSPPTCAMHKVHSEYCIIFLYSTRADLLTEHAHGQVLAMDMASANVAAQCFAQCLC